MVVQVVLMNLLLASHLRRRCRNYLTLARRRPRRHQYLAAHRVGRKPSCRRCLIVVETAHRVWLRGEVLYQHWLRFDWIRSEALASYKLTDLTHQVSIALHLRFNLVYFALDALDRAVRDAHAVYFRAVHVALSLFHDEEALNLLPGLVAEDRHGKLQVRQLGVLPPAGPVLGVRRQLVVIRVGRASIGALGVARA